MHESIRDAVHGDIYLTKEEMAVVRTPQFQRLGGVRQLGLAHHIYPSAQHTRFEHTLGVVYMADRIVDAVVRNEAAFAEEQRAFVRALALVHDIGHLPFGHTLEDERPLFDKSEKHDAPARLRKILMQAPLSDALSHLGQSFGNSHLIDDLCNSIQKTSTPCDAQRGAHTPPSQRGSDMSCHSLASFVGDTVCADLLDYLARDTYFTGLRHRYDERIISAFRFADGQLYLELDAGNRELRRSVVSEVFNLLRLRYTLGERVYFHESKAALSAMISKAVELSGLPQSWLADLRDEELLFVLGHPDILKVGDQEILDKASVGYLVDSIRNDRLYEAAYFVNRPAAGDKVESLAQSFHDASNRTAREEAEEWIAKACGLKPHEVIVFCHNPGMAKKAVEVMVHWPDQGTHFNLEELHRHVKDSKEAESVSEEIEQLKRKHESLWSMMVYTTQECSERHGDYIRACCEERFGVRGVRKSSRTLLPIYRRALETVFDGANDGALDRARCLSVFDDPKVAKHLTTASATALRAFMSRQPVSDAPAADAPAADAPGAAATSELFVGTPAAPDANNLAAEFLRDVSSRRLHAPHIKNYEKQYLSEDAEWLSSRDSESRRRIQQAMSQEADLPRPDHNRMSARDFHRFLRNAASEAA